MGRVYQAGRCKGKSADKFVFGDANVYSDYEIEADDGCDLIEQIREARQSGRDFSIETDW